ncbi:polysaccharide pyruvyl transferase family protein [Staphylococcus epidermidis]|uniref:polysaccharide pyruvyl transferase family protein n=1 Tax=Staphylococcus epidermidis TaxID=1282 RepID=UPI001D14EF69|nr:polysaccharide pyruvyl transferase family protein [Staphylococcus epidermidis]
MKRYLIRSGITPTEIKEPSEMILKNLIGGNVGNLIYAYSIYRTLMTEDVEIIPDRYRINEKDADYINKYYDAYIIPLADAFRETFVHDLKKYTKLFEKLSIPVIVIGVGVKAPIDKRIKDGFTFDEEVKEFVQAVLKKSNIIGVRGQITADYLSYLGFVEGKDHTVIGCPSMYSFGRELKIKELNLTKTSKIALNSSKLSPEHILRFITDISNNYRNYYFIPQWRKEFMMTYIGNENLNENTPFYPNTIKDKYYEENRVRYPLNAKSWINFMKEMDLAVGARLHGNITATIAGTPSLLLTKDARMKELAEYHNLTHISEEKLNSGITLDEIINQLDFHSPEKVQSRNFDHFISFLNENGLDHIYNHEGHHYPPLDRKLNNTELPKMLIPLKALEPIQISDRLLKYTKLESKRVSSLKKENKNLSQKLVKQNKKIKQLNGQLQRKSVKIGFKLGDSLATVKKKIKN